MSNKLETWIKLREENEKDVMNLLQEYGAVSDNCVMAKDVGNPTYAMKWMACNQHFLPKKN